MMRILEPSPRFLELLKRLLGLPRFKLLLATRRGTTLLEYSLICSALAFSTMGVGQAITNAAQARHQTIVANSIVGGTSNFYPVALPIHGVGTPPPGAASGSNSVAGSNTSPPGRINPGNIAGSSASSSSGANTNSGFGSRVRYIVHP